MSTLDPELERQRLAAFYSGLSDTELEKLADDKAALTDLARATFDAEMSRRGLSIEGGNSRDGVDELEFRELVTIRQFTSLPEALLAKGSLESSGIECFLADDNFIRLDWFISNLIGGIKLRVKPEEAAEANEILDQPIPEMLDVDGTGDVPQPRCPTCQSLDITFQELNQPVAYVSAALRVPIPLHRKAWLCHACRREWQDSNPPA
jgi:hypothetical protein